MENIEQKANFLRYEYLKALSRLDADAPRKWGKMNVQQMIEHISDYVRIASGKTPMQVVTPEDKLPRMQGFLASEKPFPENTPNVLMPDTPAPVKHATLQDAINELQTEIDYFFAVHEKDAGKITANPFFGDLGFEQQVQLLYKHATHHLRQFGVNY
ncbi:MAG: DinB family protein [Chitinophagales bacterium]